MTLSRKVYSVDHDLSSSYPPTTSSESSECAASLSAYEALHMLANPL